MSDIFYIDIYRRRSDNFRKECPARMSDGNFIRDHRQSIDREISYMTQSNISNEYEYKNFLQKNGKKIIDAQWDVTTKLNACGVNSPCFHNYPLHSNNKLQHNEMAIYNGVKNGSIKELPKCENHKDLSF